MWNGEGAYRGGGAVRGNVQNTQPVTQTNAAWQRRWAAVGPARINWQTQVYVTTGGMCGGGWRTSLHNTSNVAVPPRRGQPPVRNSNNRREAGNRSLKYAR